MKKLLIIALVILFIAPFAYAEKEVKVSGWYKTNGTYWDNHALRNDNEESSAVYDQDMEFTVKAMASETTGFTARIEIHDESWKDPDGGSDEDITVERAWGHHLFTTTNTKLDVGLMTGGTWGTAFADDAAGRYRVKLTQPFSENFIVVGLLEKLSENHSDVDGFAFDDPAGYDAAGNSIDAGTADEGDDGDNYAVGAIIKAGDIAIKPLVYVINANNFIATSDLDRLYLALEISGKLGPLGFESEFGYNDYELANHLPATDNEWNTYGAYLNVWANIDATKVGAVLAYGSWDDDRKALGGGQGFDFDDDFDSTWMLADEFEFGGGDGLTGMTLIQLYAAIAAGDVTITPTFSYVMSNQDDFNNVPDSNIYKDAKAWEFDLQFDYKITDVFSYYAVLGYADISWDIAGLADPEAVMMAKHGIKITF